jgi:mono/diheme cytochrome c family protein
MAEHLKEEIDWHDVLKKPEKLFGYSYIYILIVLLGIGLLYLGNLDTIGRNSVMPVFFEDTLSAVQDIPLQSPQVIPPINVMKAGISTTEMVGKGRELFKTHCASCHGTAGKGDGPSSIMLIPKPRDFTSLVGWKNGSKVSQIYKTLQEGISGGGMAAFNYLSPEDRFAMIHFIRTLADRQPQDLPQDLQQLDVTYQLAQGVYVAGQIPIKKSMRIIVQEGKSQLTKVSQLEENADTSQTIGAELLKRLAIDKRKIFASAISMHNALKSVEDYKRIISADPVHLGFKASVVRLSDEEWKMLYTSIFSNIK